MESVPTSWRLWCYIGLDFRSGIQDWYLFCMPFLWVLRFSPSSHKLWPWKFFFLCTSTKGWWIEAEVVLLDQVSLTLIAVLQSGMCWKEHILALSSRIEKFFQPVFCFRDTPPALYFSLVKKQLLYVAVKILLTWRYLQPEFILWWLHRESLLSKWSHYLGTTEWMTS